MSGEIGRWGRRVMVAGLALTSVAAETQPSDELKKEKVHDVAVVPEQPLTIHHQPHDERENIHRHEEDRDAIHDDIDADREIPQNQGESAAVLDIFTAENLAWVQDEKLLDRFEKNPGLQERFEEVLRCLELNKIGEGKMVLHDPDGELDLMFEIQKKSITFNGHSMTRTTISWGSEKPGDIFLADPANTDGQDDHALAVVQTGILDALEGEDQE